MKLTAANNKTMSTSPELGLTGKGVERVSIKEVDAAIAKYVSARDTRIEKLKKEVETKGALITLLRANKDKLSVDAEDTIIYRHDDLLVTLKHGKDDLKVKTEEGDNGDE
jgi:hypothetical protein